MSANVMVIVERQFDYPRATVFQAWTDPAIYARWRGSPGWHVENETLSLGRYCVTNLNLGYTFRTRSAKSVRRAR